MKATLYIPARALRVLLLTLAVAAGCSGGRPVTWKQMRMQLFGASAEALVKQMFESPDADLRRQAIERLSSRSGGGREPYLKAYAAMTQDPAPTVRSAAVRALGRAGATAYAKEAAALLQDRDDVVRWDAAVALDNLAAEEAVKPLCERALIDTAPDVRAAAALALRHYKRPAVLQTLLECLEDASFGVRYRASESLTELTGEQGGTERQRWRDILARKDDPFARPVKPRRPWWDWFGVSKPKAPTTRPAAKPVAKAEEPGRPWWDWFGVTKPRTATTRPAEQPVARSPRPQPATEAAAKAEKPARPWWDWFGVTKPRAAGANRPE